MNTRAQQISTPMLLPLAASILTTGLVATLFLAPPARPTLSLGRLFAHATLDLAVAACVHVVTVWTIWRLIREYLEPSAGTLALHLWAVTAWLPLVTILSAQRSLWIACIIPWAVANALIVLNLWCALDDLHSPPVHPTHPLFYVAPVPPLWRSLLPYAITVLTVEAGLVSLAAARPWSAAAFLSAAALLFLVRHPIARPTLHGRRRFSRSAVIQTAVVFFLLTTALTPFLQKAYGLRSVAALLARVPPPPAIRAHAPAPQLDYSGVILTLPPKPHAPIEPPTRSERTSPSATQPKLVTIPFDGSYWYFKAPDTRPRPNARTERGDPLKANIRSTDRAALAMEAHQLLPAPIPVDCCHALRINLLNGDIRPGAIRVEVILRDLGSRNPQRLSLGSVPIPSSQLENIPFNRPPVAESLSFHIPATLRGREFNEITVVLKPSSERALAGSRVSIKDFVLVP